MKFKFNIQKFLIFFLILILFLSFSLNLWNLFEKLRDKYIKVGFSLAVENILKQAENSTCTPFEVYKEEKKVNLINIDCLTKQIQSGQLQSGQSGQSGQSDKENKKSEEQKNKEQEKGKGGEGLNP
jgi:hypothetical protein